MEVRIASAKEIAELSKLSVRLGNIPFVAYQSIVAVLEHNQEVVGFAATQNAQHAAGSWVKEEFRRKGHSYELRHCLENQLRTLGFPVYFSLPNHEFEKELFRKYGQVTEHLVQVRHL